MSVNNRPMNEVRVQQPTVPTEQPQVDKDVKPVEVKGSYNGMEVEVLEDSGSSMADAAEELTFSAAETVERKVFDRKVASRGNAKLTAAEADKAEFMSKKVRGLSPETLKQLLGKVRETPPQSSEALAKMMREELPDPTERHAALSFLKEALTESGESPELLAFVDTILITMEAEEGPAIRAGYNINEVPVTDLATPQEHREVYRENVLSFKNAGESFTEILSSYGEEGVGRMLDYLSDSMAVDMNSLSPSLAPERMGIVNDGVATARNLANLVDDAREMLGGVVSEHGRGKEMKPGEMVDLIFRMRDGSIASGMELRAALPLRGRVNPTHDVDLLKGILDLGRKVPDRLFDSGQTRQMMLDVIQSGLDDAVDLEEKILDEME